MEARKKQDKAGELAFGNVVSKIIVAEKSGKYTLPLSDDVVVGLIQKEMKELEETFSFYKEPCHQATLNIQQQDILKFYLPKELTEKEVIEIIHRLHSNEPNKGKLVGLVCKEVGNRFDRSKVKPLIDKILS